jgi:hypothetical protein
MYVPIYIFDSYIYIWYGDGDGDGGGGDIVLFF